MSKKQIVVQKSPFEQIDDAINGYLNSQGANFTVDCSDSRAIGFIFSRTSGTPCGLRMTIHISPGSKKDYFDLSLDNFMKTLPILPHVFRSIMSFFEPVFSPASLGEAKKLSEDEFLSIFFDPSNSLATERYKSLGKVFFHIMQMYSSYVREMELQIHLGRENLMD